jgi:hypothetical protein
LHLKLYLYILSLTVETLGHPGMVGPDVGSSVSRTVVTVLVLPSGTGTRVQGAGCRVQGVRVL